MEQTEFNLVRNEKEKQWSHTLLSDTSLITLRKLLKTQMTSIVNRGNPADANPVTDSIDSESIRYYIMDNLMPAN